MRINQPPIKYFTPHQPTPKFLYHLFPFLIILETVEKETKPPNFEEISLQEYPSFFNLRISFFIVTETRLSIGFLQYGQIISSLSSAHTS